MKKTINLNENYGKRLKDELVSQPNTGGLKGEVEILVKNKESGEIESQQKHNLIVYGAREWLLKKVFNTNVANNNDFIKNSEILWFGVGNGGGEPGNPLQCGCTYGSDTDLYNPIRMRSEFNNNLQSPNPYYASRIMPNGDIQSGFYKKITYVSIKEDQANPYKRNNTIYYPNLIAEVRLEVSSDDCCGQTILNNDFEKSYADINEAALFIADRRYDDPAHQTTNLSQSNYDYYHNLSIEREYHEEGINVPQCDKTNQKMEWTSSKPFSPQSVQYYNVYVPVTSESESDYMEVQEDGTNVYFKKISVKPFLLGIYSTDESVVCTGKIELISGGLSYSFTCGNKTNNGNIELTQTLTSLENVYIKSAENILINVIKSNKLNTTETNGVVYTTCRYSNSYSSDFTTIKERSNDFGEENSHRFIFPVGYVFDSNNQLVTDDSFIKTSVIRIIQSTDVYHSIKIKEILIDNNSTECKCYVDNETILDLSEGMKIYTYNDSLSNNKISMDNPSTITEIYNAVIETGNKNTTQKSYFIIDRGDNFVNETYEGDGLDAKCYFLTHDKPYIMFNRVCFSTVRISSSREILLIWRIYF